MSFGKSQSVSSLPADGGTVYVRLWSQNAANGAWAFNDYTYTAWTAPPLGLSSLALVTGRALFSTPQTFTFTFTDPAGSNNRFHCEVRNKEHCGRAQSDYRVKLGYAEMPNRLVMKSA